MSKKGQIHIGTSGFYYKHWVGLFYPKGTKSKDWFAYYMQYFDTVELNSPFYNMPTLERFENWYQITPDSFIYSVKASRYISHIKRLHEVEDSVDLFLKNVIGLKEKLGVILIQLPPNLEYDRERFFRFIEYLPTNFRYTIEFRNQSWYREEVYTLLRMHNITFCIYHLNHHLSPIITTADFLYVRLHGPGGKYKGSYNEENLQNWAAHLEGWRKIGLDIYLYFDNDFSAYAVYNALRLKEMLG